MIPGSGRSPEEGNGNSLQYSCLEDPMDRGAWQARVRGDAKNQTQLKGLSSRVSGNYIQYPVISHNGKKYFKYKIHMHYQMWTTLCNPLDFSCLGPLSFGFPRQEYWSELPFPTPGNLLPPTPTPPHPQTHRD